MAARRVDALLTDYASYHRTRGNLVCHAFGITLIIFGSVTMLLSLRLPGATRATAAELLIGLVLLFYLTLDASLALVMLLEFAVLDIAARAIADWRAGLAAFLVGWAFQGLGHARFERNSPAFFKNLVHLMVGPLFLANELLRIRPVADAP
ncbi:MAG TPA: Mpo1-like protein [Thermoanaerobaculia bacterium]|nr:Mpo1-like protein [Thermoanaerobaculia bacterium]